MENTSTVLEIEEEDNWMEEKNRKVLIEMFGSEDNEETTE